MQPDIDHEPCRVCGTVVPVSALPGHLQTHDRDGGAPNPAPEPETKAWPPRGIETK